MKRKNNILTYKQATNIVENSNGVFTETKHSIDGFNVSIFNYRLATYENFINPINDLSLNKLELRGLTFIFNKDGSLFKRYLLMEKFFNINENKGTQLTDLNKLKIKSVYNKEDGSVISFVKLPNGKVVAKSKASFDSYQANKANFIYNNDNYIKSFVNDMLNNEIVPIFEYVSPFNKIVINYTNDELILLKLRDNETGEYINIDNITEEWNIKVPEKFNYTLDELEELSKSVEYKEGWVIEFDNGLKAKKKTEWYFSLHKLFTEDLNKENYLIEKIIKEEIDDVISILDNSPYHDFIREKVNKITNLISKYIDDKSNKVNELYDVYNSYTNIKEFVINNLNSDEFSYVMNLVKLDKLSKLSDNEINNNYDNLDKYLEHMSDLKLDNQIKNRILKKTYRLENSKDWLLKIDKNITKYINV
tara:strand:- start:3048 stop:4307 length:1260 start_codon:yes stop_codon:yes gene_type:complete